MYERFTDRARKVLEVAQKEAKLFNHEYVGTEHILLSFVKEPTAATLLHGLGVKPVTVEREIKKLMKSGPHMAEMNVLPLTPRSKRVVEFSIEEARNHNHTEVRIEHLLAGLLREQDGVAAHVLMNLRLKLEAVRQAVRRSQDRPSDEESPAEQGIGAEAVDSPHLVLLLDPGTATAEEIGELLFEFSTLYRMLGGSGITFTTTDAREPAFT